MKNWKETLLIFLRGMFMGMADIVPGVSGGTIALITGIYERLILAINAIKPSSIRQLMVEKNKTKRLEKMDSFFLAAVLLGIAFGFLMLSGVIKLFLEQQPSNTYAFFFGLILASAGFVYRYVGKISSKTLITGIIGFVFAFLFVGLSTLQSSHSLPVIFFSGFIAICAMMLPGISGAFILLFLGQYEFMLNALHAVNIPLIATFVLGAVVGIGVMSKILAYLLENYKAVTMSFLLGLMLGALRMPYNNVVSNAYSLPFVIASGIVGFFVVFALEKVSGKVGEKS
jgi:putative membrane protein